MTGDYGVEPRGGWQDGLSTCMAEQQSNAQRAAAMQFSHLSNQAALPHALTPMSTSSKEGGRLTLGVWKLYRR